MLTRSDHEQFTIKVYFYYYLLNFNKSKHVTQSKTAFPIHSNPPTLPELTKTLHRVIHKWKRCISSAGGEDLLTGHVQLILPQHWSTIWFLQWQSQSEHNHVPVTNSSSRPSSNLNARSATEVYLVWLMLSRDGVGDEPDCFVQAGRSQVDVNQTWH